MTPYVMVRRSMTLHDVLCDGLVPHSCNQTRQYDQFPLDGAYVTILTREYYILCVPMECHHATSKEHQQLLHLLHRISSQRASVASYC
jgi:hypothetical protein